MFKEYDLHVDIQKTQSLPSITFHQDDFNTAKLNISVKDNEQILDLTGASVQISIKKPDRKLIFQDCIITDASNGVLEVYLSSNSLAFPGAVQCELYIRNADQTVVTPRFTYRVQAALLSQENVESTNEFQTLNRLITESGTSIESAINAATFADDAANLARTAAESTNTAKTAAELAAVEANSAAASASTEASKATTQADYAKAQGEYAKSEADRLAGTDVSVLDNKIGSLTSLTTKNKTSMVNAVNEVTSSLADKATKQDIQNMGSASPKGTYATVAALQTAFPTGTTGIYLVTADGKWYYWNGSAWTPGWVYQSTGISDGAITPKNTNFVLPSENLFNKDDSRNTIGKLISYNGGTLTDYANGMVSHPINVTVNETYTAYLNNTSYGSNAKAVFFNESGQYVTYGTPTFVGAVGTFTVPNNPSISSMKMNVTLATKDTVMLVKGSVYPTEYIPFRYYLSDTFGLNPTQKAEVDKKITNIGNKLTGKIAVFDGDSIANAINDAQKGWAGRIATKNGMTYTNYAVDGGTITAGLLSSGGADRHWVSRSVSGYRADADYIILEGGTNDADLLGVSKLGAISYGFTAVLDDTTFSGAVESTIKQAILKYAGKKIGFIIAHKMGNMPQQDVRKAFFDRIIEICKKWGIPYINLWERSYINPEIPELKTVYYSDYQHLTTAGYDHITPLIEDWMKTL